MKELISKYIYTPIKETLIKLGCSIFGSIDNIRAFDMKYFKLINHTKWRCSTLNSFMLAMTQIGEAWLPLFVVLLAYQYFEIDVNILQKVLWSFAISGLIAQLIKRAIDRDRPTKMEDTIVVGPDPSGESFPSGHTTSAFAFCIMIALIFPQLWIPMIVFASLAGISRIYLGVHWPTDVITGATIGTITSLLVYFL